MICVCRAAGYVDGAGDDAEDRVGHSRPVEGLFAGVVLEVVQGVGGGVVGLEVEGKCVEDDVGLFDGDAAVHAGVFVYDAGIGVAVDEDVGGDGCERGGGGEVEHLAEGVSVDEGVGDQRHGEATVVDAVGVFVWVGHVGEDVLRAVFGDDFGVEGGDGVVDWEEGGLEEFGISRCDPVICEFLGDVSIYVILVICGQELVCLRELRIIVNPYRNTVQCPYNCHTAHLSKRRLQHHLKKSWCFSTIDMPSVH